MHNPTKSGFHDHHERSVFVSDLVVKNECHIFVHAIKVSKFSGTCNSNSDIACKVSFKVLSMLAKKFKLENQMSRFNLFVSYSQDTIKMVLR